MLYYVNVVLFKSRRRTGYVSGNYFLLCLLNNLRVNKHFGTCYVHAENRIDIAVLLIVNNVFAATLGGFKSS